jgi:hypothetical protein
MVFQFGMIEEWKREKVGKKLQKNILQNIIADKLI